MAIVSMLLLGVLLVYWWRAHTGHTDELTLGATSSTQSHLVTTRNMNGQAIVMVEVHQNNTAQINNQIKPYRFKDFLGWFLFIPGLWLAIKLRSLLPRPGRNYPALPPENSMPRK
jgi:hypothetical protein